jgi:adenylate kinase family enzyme
LFGGPGVGKSTVAAEVFVELKKRGTLQVEMIQEYVKAWAWEGKPVGPFDQVYILAKQLKLETRLYGKVDVVITDSPLLFSPIYERFYGAKNPMSEAAALAVMRAAEEHGVTHLHYLLPRTVPYDVRGRYQTEAQAAEVDGWMETFLTYHKLPMIRVPADNKAQFIVDDVIERIKRKTP